nr:uncharacterized protein LOC127303240 [Lolium perenne]
MSSPPPSSSHPPPLHSDVPAVLSPAEITTALRDLATTVQEIHLYLAGPYRPPPAAAPAATTGLLLLTWPSQPLVGPVAAVASQRAAGAAATLVVVAVPAPRGPRRGRGPAAAATAAVAADAAAVLTDDVPAVRWAAATAAAAAVATNTAAAAAAATETVPAFRRCGSDLGPGHYIDTARDALPPGNRKRKLENEGDFAGGLGSCSTSFVVAGSWLMPIKKLMTTDEVELMNACCADGEALKITAPDLARILVANDLMMIGDGE